MKRKLSFLFIVSLLCFPLYSRAETVVDGEPVQETILHEKPSKTPEKVDIPPKAGDKAISERLEAVMQATGWFTQIKVQVQEGVVFLYGETKNHQFKDWAGDLARKTEGVAAVVNKIAVDEPSIWDLHMILKELQWQWHKMLRAFPNILFSFVILVVSYLIARLVYRVFPLLLRNKKNPSLLNDVFAKAVSCLVFVLGVYFIFEMADLTSMALTVLSGTGIISIIIGIAFRDITENFLASILLSLYNPFHQGDLVDIVCPVTGFTETGRVERLTLRVTNLVMEDGKHLQIPNATVYKSNIRNYTNPSKTGDNLLNKKG